METFIEALTGGIVEEYVAGLAARTSDAGLGGALARGAIWGVGFAVAAGSVRASRYGLRPVIVGTAIAGDWIRELTTQARDAVHEIYVEAQTDRIVRRLPHPR